MTVTDAQTGFQGHEYLAHMGRIFNCTKQGCRSEEPLPKTCQQVACPRWKSLANRLVTSNISKTGQNYWRKLIGNHTRSIEWQHFRWPWFTSDPDFKLTTFFEVEYHKTVST